MATNKKPKTSLPVTTTSKSVEIVSSNDDLLKQILEKLPLKSLMKFTSVSKHWLSLISGPDFSRRRNSCSVSGLFIERRDNTPDYDFLDLNQTSNSYEQYPSLLMGIKILQSCNGLLLCSTKEDYYYVINPTTKKYTLLPPLPLRYKSIWGMSLAFDPSKSHYKVVCVSSETIDTTDVEDTDFLIYSSQTRTWRLSLDSFYSQVATIYQKGVFWNGAIHWIYLYEPFYFHVDEERLGSLPPVPPFENDDIYNSDLTYFVESDRGHLYIVNQSIGYDLPCFNIYQMDYSNWFFKFHVDLTDFPTMFLEAFPHQVDHHTELDDCFFKIVHIVSGDVDQDSYALIRIPGMVIKYNFKTKAFHKLCDIEAGKGAKRFMTEWGDAHQFIENMATVG